MYFLIFYWSIKLLCISISVLNTSGQCLMFLQVRFPGFECGFYCWLPTWVGKTIVFLYLIKKKNCLCEPARAGVGASNPHCFHLYISAPHCMKFVVCLDVTTSLGSTLSTPGIPGIWGFVCVTPKCFFFPSKTKDGGNSIHWQKKNPLANQGTESFGEATSPHRNPPPFPSWKAFKPLCWDPNCQGLLCCRCTLLF